MGNDLPHVLVVDDEAQICRSCAKILSRSGYEVHTASDGVEAMRLMARTTYDVVVTDLKMSRMGGMELLRRVRQSSPQTRVIVITGYATVSSAVEVLKIGACDFLPKPFTPHELRAVVQQALTGGLETIANSGRSLQHQLIGSSPPIRTVVSMIGKVAPTDATVLIQGESGTGKELVARAIHANSRRQESVFFAVDCGTLTGSLLASELFGHMRGAFTGAHQDKEGIFQRAHGGTIFLDEISNTGTEVQGMLLRFLEAREFLPVGGTEIRRVDVRLIFATNRNLQELVAAGRFREDFYYRIYVYPILMPPLRERRADILPIARHFLNLISRQLGRSIQDFDPEAAVCLEKHAWPGNVRELRNMVERAVILCEGQRVGLRDLALPPLPGGAVAVALPDGKPAPATNAELKHARRDLRAAAVADLERRFIVEALRRSDGNISRAARQTGLQRTSFQNLMKRHGVRSARDGDIDPVG